MRRVLIVLTIFMLWITACTPNAASTEEVTESSDQPTATRTSTEASPEPVPTGPAEQAVIKQLAANLGLQENDITLVSSEETEFGDSCLGITMEGVMCAQVITPGKIIVLEANGIQYEYHTSEGGDRIHPASLALVWKREGGIAGFCDTLTIFYSGEVFANKCGAEADGKMGTFATLMTAREIQQFMDWRIAFGEVRVDASDPKGVADRMVITLEFFGNGTEEPAEADQQTILGFAQDLYQKLAR